MKRRRRGTTLGELMLTLAAGSSVCIAAIGFVHQVMRVESTSRLRLNNERAAVRLAESFRADVREAVHVESLSDDELSLRMADGEAVLYQVGQREVVRTAERDGRPKHREKFIGAEDSIVRFQRKNDPERIVLLMDKRVGESPNPAGVELEIDAVVGKWNAMGMADQEPAE